mgnify:CR=1 FL=1
MHADSGSLLWIKDVRSHVGVVVNDDGVVGGNAQLLHLGGEEVGRGQRVRLRVRGVGNGVDVDVARSGDVARDVVAERVWNSASDDELRNYENTAYKQALQATTGLIQASRSETTHKTSLSRMSRLRKYTS